MAKFSQLNLYKRQVITYIYYITENSYKVVYKWKQMYYTCIYQLPMFPKIDGILQPIHFVYKHPNEILLR